jgi:hypothetical protein
LDLEMLGNRHGFAPFGWSVGCGGQRPAAVRDEVRSTVNWATRRFTSYFPSDGGYEVQAYSPAGASNGVQLQVRRGDFRATVAIEAILDPNRKSPDERAIRMYGRAGSEAVEAAERDGHRLVQRFRAGGVGLGVVLFAAALWLCVGAYSPIYILAGMFMVVAALLITTLGASFGGWLGERMAEKSWARARALAEVDPRLQGDIRRWRALSRQLANQRQALTGRVGAAPFRGLPAAPETGRRTPSRGLPRLPATSFSFSS